MSPGKRPGHTLALADGKTAALRGVQSALHEDGFDILPCQDRAELEKNLAARRIDLILLAADFPNPDGYTLCARLRKNSVWQSIPVLMILPGYTQRAIKRALDAGADDFVAAPFSPALLLRRISGLLPGARPSGSEAYYRILFDAAEDSMLVFDLGTGRILDVNRRTCQWLGYSRDELLGMSYTDIVDTSPKALSDSSSITGHFIFEQIYRTRSGASIDVEISSRVVDFGGRKAILNLARDIRPRKLVEAAEIDQRHLAEALRDTAKALNSTLNYNEVVERILRHVTRLVDCDGANIVLVADEKAQIISHTGYDQINDEPVKQIFEFPLSDLHSLQWILRHRRPLLIEETHISPFWKIIPGREWVHSYLGAPIIVEETVVGFINLDSGTPGKFTERHAEKLMAFADQAGIALRNARLYEASRQYADELEVRVRERTEALTSANALLKQQIADREAAELRLAEERNLLQTLIDNLPDQVYVKDTNSRFVMANRATLRNLGASSIDEIRGKTDFDFSPAEWAQQHFDEEKAIFKTGQPLVNKEEALAGPDYRLLVTKVPLRDEQGSIIGLVGINRDITELKQAEERLIHIVSGVYCVLWYATASIIDDKMQWEMYISTPDDIAQKFMPLNLAPGQTYADAWVENILPEDYARIQETTRAALLKGEAGYRHEFRCRRADGEIRWLYEDVRIRPLTADRWYLVGVCTDVTERKASETALQRANDILEQRVAERTEALLKANLAERQQRKLAEALRDTAAALSQTLDLNQVLDLILTSVARVVPPHDVATVMVIEDEIYVRAIRSRAYHAADRQQFSTDSSDNRIFLDSLPDLRRILNTGQPVVIPDLLNEPVQLNMGGDDLRSYMGAPIYAEGHIIGFINLGSKQVNHFNEEDADRLFAFTNQAGMAIQNARLYDAIRRHATDLRRRVAERTAELEHEQAHLRAILDAMTEGVIYYDNDGDPHYVNQSLVQMTGYSAEEWLRSGSHTPAAEAFSAGETQPSAIIRDTLRRHGIWRGEIKLHRKGGEAFEASMVTTAVIAPDGSVNGTVVVLRDISQEKRLQTQKSRFIANASHELRTPLTNIKTRLYLISKQPDKLETHLEVLESVTNRMRKLVDDLLDISRFDNGIIPLASERLVLQDLVRAAVEVQRPEAERKSLSLTLDVSEGPLHISGDYARLTQVMTNLLTNAINYTPERGQIRVEAAPDADTHALVRVSDTGIGIPADHLPSVFEPFFRATEHNAGAGLGLSISKEIIELHGGEIYVESQEGVGTCFTIRLALAQPVVSSHVALPQE